MARSPYVSPVSQQTEWLCGHCPAVLDSLEAWRAHLSSWDGARPIKPACPGVLISIEPNPRKRSQHDRYAVRVRELVLAGSKTSAAMRTAGVELGWREPPKPMPEDVKVLLRERNETKAEVRRCAKRRQKAKQ